MDKDQLVDLCKQALVFIERVDAFIPSDLGKVKVAIAKSTLSAFIKNYEAGILTDGEVELIGKKLTEIGVLLIELGIQQNGSSKGN